MKRLSEAEFKQNLNDSGLCTAEELAAALAAAGVVPATDGEELAETLIVAGKLTPFQVEAVRERRFEELTIGNYQVLDRLGQGGMGTVYKARHRRMKRVVAIKVLSREIGKNEKLVRRFQREVEAVARLSHPNIVMAYDADEAEIGHFLVMEFVDGRDLASVVETTGPLGLARAVDCIAQAARALDYAHGQGIVHRDIKPANLMRDIHGVVKVADLGLARVADPFGAGEGAAGLTQAGTIMGTVDYMPPEQTLGLPNIDHRADIYSLGCTLHYLLMARPPYQGATLMAILLEHRDGAIPSLRAARPEVPEALDQIFRRMVAKKPDDRFASMAEVASALAALSLPPDPPKPAVKTAPATVTSGPLQATTPALDAGTTDRTIDLAPARALGAAGTSVLLVEPSRTQATIIRGYLQKLGFPDVPTVNSAEKALEAVRNTPPQIVICTMQLPDMTGMQLVQQMRAEKATAGTAFVLITSEADAHGADLSGQSNTARLVKPFDLARLAQALVAAGSAVPQNPLRVLIVDDSSAARAHARRVLTTLGFGHFFEASDGAEAVEILGKERFDLVVTDYNMPRLDGRGLVDFIRNRSSVPTVPVVLFTTETDPGKLEAVRRLGVSAICEKSLPAEIVRRALQTGGPGHLPATRGSGAPPG